MRNYNDLTEEEKGKAKEKSLNSLLNAVCEGGLRFNDKANKDELQKHIDEAWTEMERLQTPWFIVERLMEDEYIKSRFEGMAQADAEDALYPDKTERIIRL